mmetsp:Transcript_35657/g.75951  ORF Transcript_35657/g.75951 Transcript_35657/m.75951 type:complete len:364 (-) Transcript_35657:667-1758(-)
MSATCCDTTPTLASTSAVARLDAESSLCRRSIMPCNCFNCCWMAAEAASELLDCCLSRLTCSSKSQIVFWAWRCSFRTSEASIDALSSSTCSRRRRSSSSSSACGNSSVLATSPRSSDIGNFSRWLRSSLSSRSCSPTRSSRARRWDGFLSGLRLSATTSARSWRTASRASAVDSSPPSENSCKRLRSAATSPSSSRRSCWRVCATSARKASSEGSCAVSRRSASEAMRDSWPSTFTLRLARPVARSWTCQETFLSRSPRPRSAASKASSMPLTASSCPRPSCSSTTFMLWRPSSSWTWSARTSASTCSCCCSSAARRASRWLSRTGAGAARRSRISSSILLSRRTASSNACSFLRSFVDCRF